MVKKTTKHSNTWLLLLSCAMFLLASCATTMSRENAVEERAKARWETLLAGDLDGAYEFLSPGFRSSVSSLQYQRSLLLKRIRWDDAQVIESECEETTCIVRISLDYTLHGALPGVSSFSGTQKYEESWLLVNGSWYFVPEK
jgi:hypothetical protein